MVPNLGVVSPIPTPMILVIGIIKHITHIYISMRINLKFYFPPKWRHPPNRRPKFLGLATH